jgi:hypothetical protein
MRLVLDVGGQRLERGKVLAGMVAAEKQFTA